MTKYDDPTRRDLMRVTAAAALVAAGAPSADLRAGGIGPLAAPGPAPSGEAAAVAHGIVYADRTGTGAWRAGFPGLEGVRVSNGRDVVRTDADGRYLLPIGDGDAVFVIKPKGYAVPLDTATRLPRFSSIRQARGTPAGRDLRRAGIAPSGPRPESVDFGLIESPEPSRFEVVLLSDPQPETRAESEIGLPWGHIGGNRDLDFAVPDAFHSRESFERAFGATHYAFEYGDALFLALDNVEYLAADPARPSRNGKYRGCFGERQLAFVANVLAATPPDRLVVAAMPVPLVNYLDPTDPSMNTSDRLDFLALLGDRPAVSFASHAHTTEHHYFGYQDGFAGTSPHHHHILMAVSGSRGSGARDRSGIASADSGGGAAHGFHVLAVDGHGYSTRFVPARSR